MSHRAQSPGIDLRQAGQDIHRHHRVVQHFRHTPGAGMAGLKSPDSAFVGKPLLLGALAIAGPEKTPRTEGDHATPRQLQGEGLFRRSFDAGGLANGGLERGMQCYHTAARSLPTGRLQKVSFHRQSRLDLVAHQLADDTLRAVLFDHLKRWWAFPIYRERLEKIEPPAADLLALSPPTVGRGDFLPPLVDQ